MVSHRNVAAAGCWLLAQARRISRIYSIHHGAVFSARNGANHWLWWPPCNLCRYLNSIFSYGKNRPFWKDIMYRCVGVFFGIVAGLRLSKKGTPLNGATQSGAHVLSLPNPIRSGIFLWSVGWLSDRKMIHFVCALAFVHTGSSSCMANFIAWLF